MKKMWLLFAAFFASLILSADVTLSDGSKTIPIVTPADSTAARKTAVKELAVYLGKITGKTFSVVTESANLPDSAIYVGPTSFAAKQGVDSGKLGDEEWIVRSVGKNLIITGGEPRGTLYGVYHFLEDVLGVLWLTPYVEQVPKMEKLTVGDLNLTGKPSMPYRDIYLLPGAAGNTFRARNRMNTQDRNYGGRMLFSNSGACHTLYPALGNADAIKKLYQEHPEYFPLIDGVRKLDATRANGAAQTQFCMTNPGLRKLWVETLRGHIKKDKEIAAARGIQPPMFYAVDQNDCYDGFCTCPACDAIVKREGSKAGLMLDFVNHVAKELKDEAPGSIFQMMAIHCTEPPPKQLKPLPNVGIRLCDTTSNILKPWSDPQNAKHRKNLEDWAKICKNIAMWDYSIVYGSPICINYPVPTLRTFGPDLQMLAKNNGSGVFFEHEQVVGADLRDLKVWIEFKMAENPNLDYDKLLKTFTDAYYGSAAGAKVRDYLSVLENAAKRGNANVTWFPSLSSFAFIDAETMIQAAALLDEAEKLAASKEQKERVEHARLSLDRLYLIRAGAYRKALTLAGKDVSGLPDYAAALERYQRVWKREMNVRDAGDLKNSAYKSEYESNMTKFLSMAAKRKDLPHPKEFKAVPPDALYLFGSGLAQTYINYLKLVKDPESPAGEALRATMEDIMKTPHKDYREHKYVYPFSWTVWPTMNGTVQGKTAEGLKTLPKGYHWYKLAENLKLTKESSVGMFAGFFIAMDGVVSDNSELGQEYDIWASIKVTGPDFFKTGKPGKDNVFYIDQVAVIRKTSNAKK